jgi:hypothetical protein
MDCAALSNIFRLAEVTLEGFLGSPLKEQLITYPSFVVKYKYIQYPLLVALLSPIFLVYSLFYRHFFNPKKLEIITFLFVEAIFIWTLGVFGKYILFTRPLSFTTFIGFFGFFSFVVLVFLAIF